MHVNWNLMNTFITTILACTNTALIKRCENNLDHLIGSHEFKKNG